MVKPILLKPVTKLPVDIYSWLYILIGKGLEVFQIDLNVFTLKVIV